MNIKGLFAQDTDNARLIDYPYFIAEIGVNHGCDIELAKCLIDQAKQGGADAVKFQAYKADSLAVKDSLPYWDTAQETTGTQYELFKKYDKFWKDEFSELKEHCDRAGIDFLATPFDEEAAYFLDGMSDAFKISSSDITNKPLIEFICEFGKPIILSTGASDIDEVDRAVEWIRSRGNKLALLHCVLNYPTLKRDVNIGMITHLSGAYPDLLIGYSDHSANDSIDILIIAVLSGARIIEKHFTHNKSLPGNDHYHAMDKEDLLKFRSRMKDVLEILGDFQKHPLASEQKARQFARRSLVAKKKILGGQKIKKGDITSKRPGTGISPGSIDEVIGSEAIRDIEPDEILNWDLLSKK